MRQGVWRKLTALLTALALLLACAAFATEEEPVQPPQTDVLAADDDFVTEDDIAADDNDATDEDTVVDEDAVTDEDADVDEDAVTDEEAVADGDSLVDGEDEVVAPEALTPPEAASEDDDSGISLMALAPTDNMVAPTPSATTAASESYEDVPGYTGTACTDPSHVSGWEIDPSYMWGGYTEYEPYDDTYHKQITWSDGILYLCKEIHSDGNMRRWYEHDVNIEYVPHYYVEGICRDCGAECSPHDWDAATGTCKHCGMICAHDGVSAGACPICGMTLHVHTWDNGGEQSIRVPSVCADCGAKCYHEVADENATVVDRQEKCEMIDEERHTYNMRELRDWKCDVCGASGTDVGEWVYYGTDPHELVSMPDGSIKCRYCEYTVSTEKCAHPNRIKTDRWYTLETAIDNRDGKTHRVEAMRDDDNTCWYCPDCGLWWDNNIGYDYDFYKNDPHQWVNGACWICGAKQPAPVTAGNPTPTPAPEIREVPADEPVHGVAVDDNLRMGVALAKAMENLTAENGKGALLEIEGADKLLTSAESYELSELSPAEQVLVLMQVLGCKDEGDNATLELNLSLSFGARRLLASIQSRLDAMTADEAAAFADLLAKYFPVVNGKMEITLLTNVNGWQRERYTFEQVNGAWMFVKLTIIR